MSAVRCQRSVVGSLARPEVRIALRSHLNRHVSPGVVNVGTGRAAVVTGSEGVGTHSQKGAGGNDPPFAVAPNQPAHRLVMLT